MFVTTGFALFLIASKLLMGSFVGLLLVRFIYRSRFSTRLAIAGAVLGGVAFLIASGVVGWAGSHAVFIDGHRMDVAPWGEDLWLRNRIADNELPITLASSCIAALLVGFAFKAQRSPSSQG